MGGFRDYEDALPIAIGELRRGNDAMAKQLARAVDELDRHELPLAQEATAIALFGLAEHATTRGRHQEAHRRREQALAKLDRMHAPGDSSTLQDMIADALIAMGENRRALPFCNRAIALSDGASTALGARLWRAGRCHNRVGFEAAAASLLRDAVARLRETPGHVLLPHALLDLGNAVMQAAPGEAQAAIAEAASLFEAGGDLVNAGTAWLNLGVSRAKAGELDAALAAYAKARELRERNPSTTVAQRGSLHNNVAGVFRRKRDFARARAEAAQALALLKSVGGEFHAHALGTMGEIALDEHLAEEALDWFSQARALFERLPNTSSEKLATKLENEAKALSALHRDAEAAALQARVSALRGEAAPPAPAIAEPAPPPAGEVVIAFERRPDGLAPIDLGELSARLEEKLEETGAGELDGYLIGADEIEIHLFGPEAQALHAAVAPALRDFAPARVELRQHGAVVSARALAH